MNNNFDINNNLDNNITSDLKTKQPKINNEELQTNFPINTQINNQNNFNNLYNSNNNIHSTPNFQKQTNNNVNTNLSNNNTSQRIKLKKELHKDIYLTLIIIAIFSYNLYKILTFSGSDLFGNLGCMHNYIIIYLCLIILFCVWLSYAESYSKIMVDKKYRKIPLLIMKIIGISILFFSYLSIYLD